MRSALGGGDADEYLGMAETLLMLMQQHNIKEEQVLYSLSERALGADAGGVLRRMQDRDAA
jgi:iron-sulfur cluster repair protein YtfE (RIC family)